MARVHRTVLREIRRETVSWREHHRRTLQREREAVRNEMCRHSEHRSVPRAEHRHVLKDAKRIAKEGLEAHRRALEANPWILRMVEMYERMQAAGAERDRRRAERKAARERRAAVVRTAGSQA